MKTAGLLLVMASGVAATLAMQMFIGKTDSAGTPNRSSIPGDRVVLLQTPEPVPLATAKSVAPGAIGRSPVTGSSDKSAEPDKPAEIEQIRQRKKAEFFSRLEMSQIGLEPLSNSDFARLVDYLKGDPELLDQFLVAFRENSDPGRARWLAQVLRHFDQETITTVAEGLVYSGDVASQVAGLDLLGGQQNRNPAAREIVSQLLDIETHPTVISAALNALSTPGEVSVEQRTRLLDQFATHFADNDPAVRRRSMTLLQRWAGEENMNKHYFAGLQDPDKGVRTGAVLALVSTPHPGEKVYRSLLGVIENGAESHLLRRSALQGLENYGISDDEKQHYLNLIEGG